MTNLKPFREYIRSLERNLVHGNATEHTHRPALKTLLESLEPGLVATNEPRCIECGAPDFIVSLYPEIVGYIEAKDVGTDLDYEQRSNQLQRYLGSLSNLVLTDYLEFRWFVDGALQDTARLATLDLRGSVAFQQADALAVVKLLEGFVARRSPPLGTARELAERMARLAHMIRDLILGPSSVRSITVPFMAN